MTATLQEIHLNPEILDRAIAARENLDITSGGKPAATLVPVVHLSRKDACEIMRKLFANPQWQFAVGTPMSREERNSRG
jgi:hypothetical protein